MLTVEFQRALAHPVAVTMRRSEAPDIDRPDVERRLVAGNPLREHLARTASRGDAKGVEARAHEIAHQARGRADDEIAVGREALRPVDQLLDSGCRQRGHPWHGQIEDRLKMIPVGRQQLEIKIIRKTIGRPGPWIGLVAAHNQAADLFLVVSQAIGIAQRGQAALDARNHVGDEILMLHRDQRHADTGHGADLPCPLTGAIDDHFAADSALARQHRRHPTTLKLYPEHVGVLEDPDAAQARTLGKRLGDVGGIDLTVGGQKRGAHQVGNVHQRPQLLRFAWRQQLHFEAEGTRAGRLPLEFSPAGRIAGQAQTAVHLPAARQPSLGLERAVERH